MDVDLGQEVPMAINGTVARKKGLSTGAGYVFSVKPVLSQVEASLDDVASLAHFSASSIVMQVANMSKFMRELLPRTLMLKTPTGAVSVADTENVLAGKVVAMYFSAHWCGPCRNFTPQLINLYKQVTAVVL